MTENVLVSGPRDVRASLNRAREDAAACVVACPPHPQRGGDRRDSRLGSVSEALADRGIDCLRFDYGPWDEGRGERTDVENAVEWARDRYSRVGLFGYSFGATLALVVAPGTEIDAVSALAPDTLGGELDVVGAIRRAEGPGQVVYGERDERVDWRPAVEAARDRGFETVGVPTGHAFASKTAEVAASVAEFFERAVA